ncbi:MAG: type II toxin-antitoxin system RelE/ParE family toxin [Verrucomicrobiota bacterium]
MPLVKRSKANDQDLIEIWLFIAEDDPSAADQMLDFIEVQLQGLASSPTMGRVRYDLWPDAMCFPIFKNSWRMRYMVFYRSIPGGIEVARIIEGHRDIPNILTGDEGA